MATGMNKVFLLGNLGADPEVRQPKPGGDNVLKLRVATSERWKDRDTGELKERTDWHYVSLWGKRAVPLSGILKKGDRVMVEGQIRTSSSEKDGQMRYYTEVRATDVHLAGGPRLRRDDDIIVEHEEPLMGPGPMRALSRMEAQLEA